MALPATDTFTSVADQALTTYSASWSNNVGSAVVLGATDDVRGVNAGTNENLVRWNADVFSNDQYSQVSLSQAPQGQDSGPAARCAGSAVNTAYTVILTSGLSELYRVVSSGFTQIASSATIPVINDVIRIECSGTSISVKKNGSAFLGPVTDSSITSGSGGMWVYLDVSGRLDNFEAGNLTAGTKALPIVHKAYRMWKKRR